MIAFYERADAFGEGMLTDAKNWLRNNDPNFLENAFLEVGYPRNVSPTDAAQLIADANAKGFGASNDGVLLLGIAQDAVTFINVLRMKNVQSRIFFNEPDLLVFKAAAERHIPIAGVRVLSVYWPNNAMVNAFHDLFQEKFNDEPSFSAALAYDAARILLRAIDVAIGGPERPNDIQTLRDRIIDNLQKNAGPSWILS